MQVTWPGTVLCASLRILTHRQISSSSSRHKFATACKSAAGSVRRRRTRSNWSLINAARCKRRGTRINVNHGVVCLALDYSVVRTKWPYCTSRRRCPDRHTQADADSQPTGRLGIDVSFWAKRPALKSKPTTHPPPPQKEASLQSSSDDYSNTVTALRLPQSAVTEYCRSAPISTPRLLVFPLCCCSFPLFLLSLFSFAPRPLLVCTRATARL